MIKLFFLVSILFLFNEPVIAWNDDDYEENRSAGEGEIVTTECYLCHGNNGEGSSS